MFTNDFKRLLVGFVQGDTLTTLRLATKAWKRVADAFVDVGVRSGAMMVHSYSAFKCCSELKSMTIPDSLQTLGTDVFLLCPKLVPSNIDILDSYAVVAYLPSQQQS
ncbi:hypothetical protein TrLO_g15181 [Triparma laevis f. longispina]|nr:hypothetical protein TrLO_g15181 [Triparma laevis f. longispina]